MDVEKADVGRYDTGLTRQDTGGSRTSRHSRAQASSVFTYETVSEGESTDEAFHDGGTERIIQVSAGVAQVTNGFDFLLAVWRAYVQISSGKNLTH